MSMHHFWVKNGPFAPNKNFSGKKLLILFSSTYWPLSLCKIFKKIFQLIQNYEDVLSVLGPKWPICPNKIFFGKPINKSSKTLFLGHFCPMGIFSKKFSCHTQLYMGPEHHAKFQKKINEPILRKPTDRWKEGRTDPIS